MIETTYIFSQLGRRRLQHESRKVLVEKGRSRTQNMKKVPGDPKCTSLKRPCRSAYLKQVIEEASIGGATSPHTDKFAGLEDLYCRTVMYYTRVAELAVLLSDNVQRKIPLKKIIYSVHYIRF